MTPAADTPWWPRWRTGTLAVAAVAIVLAIAGWWLDPRQFYASYLWAWRFWLGCSLGALAVLAIHHLVGGGWGGTIRRPLEAASLVLPWLGVLFVPVLFGLPHLFPWAHPEAAADPILGHQRPYLNTGWFIARAVVYFVAWSLIAWWLRRLSDEQDRTGDPALVTRLAGASALALVVYGVTGFFAAVDWGMALEPHWFSTAYGLVVDAHQIVTGFGVAILTLVALRRRPEVAAAVVPQHFNDLGNLLLASIMSWAYVAYSQLLVIWSGNLPADNTWYVHRGMGGWGGVAAAIALLAFALPFGLLLPRGVKREPSALAFVAFLALAGQLLYTDWQVMPSLRPVAGLHWLDVVLPLGIGAIWLYAYLATLARRPLLPLHGEPIRETPDHAYHAPS